MSDSQQRVAILWAIGNAGWPPDVVSVDPVEMLDAYAAEVWDEARRDPNLFNPYFGGRPMPPLSDGPLMQMPGDDSEQQVNPRQPVVVDPPVTVVVRATMKTWALDTAVRAVKTFAQSSLGAMVIGTAATATTQPTLATIPWTTSLSIGAAAAVLSVLQNVQSIPLGSNQG